MNRQVLRTVCSRSKKRRDCAGYSLIELTVTISLSSIIMGMVLTTMVSLFQCDQNFNERFAYRTEFHRLSSSIRSDIHQAAEMDWDASTQTLHLNGPDQVKIQYQFTDGSGLRTITLTDNSIKQIRYLCRDSFTWSCEPSNANEGVLVKFKILNSQPTDRSSKKHSLPQLHHEIVATVGRGLDYLGE